MLNKAISLFFINLVKQFMVYIAKDINEHFEAT